MAASFASSTSLLAFRFFLGGGISSDSESGSDLGTDAEGVEMAGEEDVATDGVLCRFTFGLVLTWPLVAGAATGVGLGVVSMVGIGAEEMFCA
jgi:hypothetical protein